MNLVMRAIYEYYFNTNDITDVYAMCHIPHSYSVVLGQMMNELITDKMVTTDYIGELGYDLNAFRIKYATRH